MRLTVTTFNLENLFNRYAFLDMPWEERNYEKIVQAVGLVSVASRKGDLVSYETTEIQRNNTARAILDSEPDVLAVQEVENLYTLRLFNEEYLDNYFDRMLLMATTRGALTWGSWSAEGSLARSAMCGRTWTKQSPAPR